MSKEAVAVRIAGHNYKILSDGDADLLRKIASYVDQAMNQVRKRTGTVDTLDVAVLTCLNLAREVLALRDQQNDAVEDDRMRSLIERVETILGSQIASGATDVDASQHGSVLNQDDQDDQDDRSEVDDSTKGSEDEESMRTLDLPSVETLRDRATPSTPSTAASDENSTEESLPEARFAAGGRERAS
jgi:cell division protein ZapA (FtsZ GTPase activity inhibitor)